MNICIGRAFVLFERKAVLQKLFVDNGNAMRCRYLITCLIDLQTGINRMRKRKNSETVAYYLSCVNYIKPSSKKYKMKDIALIFDLDETILPASEVPDETFDPLLDAIRKANKGKVTDKKLEQAFSEIKYLAIDVLAEKYGFSKAMENAAREVLCNSNYSFELSPYEDYDIIKKMPGVKVLVTSGVVNLQQAKIDGLHIEDDFDEIIIDDLYAAKRPGKKEIFAGIADKYKLMPEQVWIIGDNPEAEINAGNELGMITVLRINEEDAKISGQPTFSISSFEELKKLVTESIKINL